MILGLEGFTALHVFISLFAIAAGFVVVGGFFAGRDLATANLLFLLTSLATSATGFLFPFSQILPSHVVALLSLGVLAVAFHARYRARLVGRWRGAYVLAAIAALYLNVFVLIAQTFGKNPALAALAPTQSEAPFVLTQTLALLGFIFIGRRALGAPEGLSR